VNPSRRSWKTIAWDLRVLWLTILILVVVDLSLQGMRREGPSSLAALQNQAAAPAPAQVMVAGSSRLRFVDLDAVSRAARNAPVVSVAFNGGTLEATDVLTERYLTPAVTEAAGAKLLVLGLGPMDLNDNYENAIVTDGWNLGHFFGHVWDHGTGPRTRRFLLRSAPVRWSGLFAAVRRGQLRGHLRGIALRWMGALGLGSSAAPAPAPAPSTPTGVASVVENRSAVSGDGAKSIADVPRPLSSIYLQRFTVGGRQWQRLRRLAERLRRQGVALVLVHTPVSDWYAHVYTPAIWSQYLALLQRAGKELDVPVFVHGKAKYGLVDADYFTGDGRFDGHHIISEAGLTGFGTGIGEIVSPLLARLNAGEAIGFADGHIDGGLR